MLQICLKAAKDFASNNKRFLFRNLFLQEEEEERCLEEKVNKFLNLKDLFVEFRSI